MLMDNLYFKIRFVAMIIFKIETMISPSFSNNKYISFSLWFCFSRPDKGEECNRTWHFNVTEIKVFILKQETVSSKQLSAIAFVLPVCKMCSSKCISVCSLLRGMLVFLKTPKVDRVLVVLLEVTVPVISSSCSCLVLQMCGWTC